ncbi:RluA family pseudouridine synthase [Candidatus Similichlamydia epinepheli]|uniref:RluA family pseudouridine synthase n=1 Tax=Candidatus Similichlamydia epinepheli TaxID=1903953 RepID=UPI000D3B1B31|nr:RluA family pseudouridine synthase [Candidatus Similichlamydia epinepheli]
MTRTRLDIWLTEHYPSYSRSYFHRLIQGGSVRVNGRQEKKSSFVNPEDLVEVEFLSENFDISPLLPSTISLHVVYEDEFLIVVNKPAGMVVHPGPGHYQDTFVQALLHHCVIERDDPLSVRPGIVHRLDRETSGLIIAAKTIQVQKALCEQFSKREIKKEYILLASGRLRTPNCSVEVPVGRDPKDRKKMKASLEIHGRSAFTRFVEHDFSNSISFISAFPVTGRQHQIRVHLRFLGLCLLGDKLYGSQDKNVQRHMLHAFRLSFLHPIHKTKIALESPLAEDFCILCSRYGFNLESSLRVREALG